MALQQWSPRAQKAVRNAAQRDVLYSERNLEMTEEAEVTQEVEVTQELVSVPTYTEAPCSMNIKVISPSGFDIMLTLRDMDTGSMLERMGTAVEWLSSKGYKPTHGSTAPAAVAAAKPAQGSESDPSWCAVHQEYMKQRGKNGDTWYSHQVLNINTDEMDWCNGK